MWIYSISKLKCSRRELAEKAKIDSISNDPYRNQDIYDMAVALIKHEHKVSINLLQKKLDIGYVFAAKILQRMEVEGLVGPSIDLWGPREVLVNADKT